VSFGGMSSAVCLLARRRHQHPPTQLPPAWSSGHAGVSSLALPHTSPVMLSRGMLFLPTLTPLTFISTYLLPFAPNSHDTQSPSRLLCTTQPSAAMSTDEGPGGRPVDMVARLCGAGHPLQLPDALKDAAGARFAHTLRQPAPVKDAVVRPLPRKRPRSSPSRPRPSSARRKPRVNRSSSGMSSEPDPMNWFNEDTVDTGNGVGRGEIGEGSWPGVGDGISGGDVGDEGGGTRPAVGDGVAARRAALTDEPDNRPSALPADHRSADLISLELVLVRSGKERTGGALSPFLRLLAVSGGAAMVVGEREHEVITWLTWSGGRRICLCFCCGRRCAESLKMRE